MLDTQHGTLTVNSDYAMIQTCTDPYYGIMIAFLWPYYFLMDNYLDKTVYEVRGADISVAEKEKFSKLHRHNISPIDQNVLIQNNKILGGSDGP